MAKLCVMAWLAAGALWPFPAQADTYPMLIHPQNHEICPIQDYNAANYGDYMANRQQYGIIKRIVYCVQGLVIPAAYQIMYSFSVNYIYGPVAAACTLAVVLWGLLMISGKNSAPMRDGLTVAIKIGAVFMFTFVMGQSALFPAGLFPVIIAVTDNLAAVVSNYIGYSTTLGCAANLDPTDIWGKVDYAINSLIGGIFNPAMLIAGMAGFFISALISGTFGLFVALAGFVMIFVLIFAILRATYITITAYIAIALMCIISPIFITMILFRTTYAYFEKWLKLTIGFILQPLFLFAYLSMMLAAFDTVVYDGPFSVYRAVVGPEFDRRGGTYPASPISNPCGDFLIGNWLWDNGVYQEADTMAMGVGTNPRLSPQIASTNTGLSGQTGSSNMPSSMFNQRTSAGMPQNVLNNFAAMNVFKVNMPAMAISWDQLTLNYYDRVRNDLSDEQMNALRLNYLIQLIISLLIAMMTLFIFYIMLDLLPFISAGIGGDKYSMPKLGANGLGMPGSGAMSKLQGSFGKLLGGG